MAAPRLKIEARLLSSVPTMKSVFQAAVAILGFSLCLGTLSGVARAAVDPPQIVPEPAMTPKPTIVLTLEAAIADLQMSSETDAPFQVVFFEIPAENSPAPQKMKPEQWAKLAGAPDDAKIETRDLNEFFEVAAKEEEWMNAEERALAQRFAALLKTLKTELKDAQVIVWGEAEKQVAIIGNCDGGAAGVMTIVVET